jgi:hypothetical protein
MCVKTEIERPRPLYFFQIHSCVWITFGPPGENSVFRIWTEKENFDIDTIVIWRNYEQNGLRSLEPKHDF